jgi:hypothetical protein
MRGVELGRSCSESTSIALVAKSQLFRGPQKAVFLVSSLLGSAVVTLFPTVTIEYGMHLKARGALNTEHRSPTVNKPLRQVMWNQYK